MILRRGHGEGPHGRICALRWLGLLLAIGACKGEPTDDFAGLLDLASQIDGGVAAPIAPTIGYVEGRKVEYYDFGPVEPELNRDRKPASVRAGAIYWFYEGDRPLARLALGGDGKPLRDDALLARLDEPAAPCFGLTVTRPPGEPCQASVSQHPVVATIPGQEGYTPFWQVHRVLVPPGYAIDSIKSKEAIDRSGYRVEPTGMLIHCPLVDETTALLPGVADRARLRVRLLVWFRRMLGTCMLVEGADQLFPEAGAPPPPFSIITDALPDRGGTRTVLRVPLREAYVPTWTHRIAMTTLETSAVPDNVILTAAPGDPTYSPVVRMNTVTVGAGYLQGTFVKLGDIEPSLIRSTETFHDLVVRGAIPTCRTHADCAPLGLTCDFATRLCQAPPAGLGAFCGPGVATCQGRSADFPSGLTCLRRRDNRRGRCYLGCNPDELDRDPGEETDSRCLSVRGMVCRPTVPYGCQSDQSCPYGLYGGVCLKDCNRAIDDPGAAPGGGSTQCTTETLGPGRPNYTAGQICVQTTIEACSWTDDYRPAP